MKALAVLFLTAGTILAQDYVVSVRKGMPAPVMARGAVPVDIADKDPRTNPDLASINARLRAFNPEIESPLTYAPVGTVFATKDGLTGASIAEIEAERNALRPARAKFRAALGTNTYPAIRKEYRDALDAASTGTLAHSRAAWSAQSKMDRFDRLWVEKELERLTLHSPIKANQDGGD